MVTTRVCIDFDGVIYNLVKDALEIYNKSHNTSIKYEDIKNYHVPNEMLKAFNQVKYLNKDKDNAIEYIKKLSEKHDIYILTASAQENLVEKIRWIEKNLPFIGYKKLIIAQNKYMVDCDVIIDDYEWNIIGHKAKFRFLVDAPYNKNVMESDKLIRVKDLKKVIEILG